MIAFKALVLWVVILGLAFLNGLLRELVLFRSLSPDIAFTVSGLVLSGGILAFAALSIPWLGRLTLQRYLALGMLWVALTLVFEFGFGLWRGNPLSALLDAYRFRNGNIWPVVLVVVLLAPAVGALARGLLPSAERRPGDES